MRALARWSICSVLLLGVQSAAAEPVHASSAERAHAEALKRRADGEMESLRYADALAHYEEAYQVTHDPALLYNRARVLEALERFAEALELLERFAAEAPPELRAQVPKLKELLEELKRRVATLTIRCAVANARVLVRDRVIATTPVAGPIRVNSGQAALEVDAEGYLPFRKTIDLPGAGALDVEVVLVAREASGEVVVTTAPEAAEVMLDGKSLGRAPVEVRAPPGNHLLVVRHDGYVEATRSFVLTERERKSLEVSLLKSPPITARWWFWTGVGVVVVGTTAAVLAYALGTEKSAGRGDIPPGQVSGPLLRF